MPLLSGIDFLKTLKNSPKIIFTTAYRNYAIESYELDVLDYLLKPISFQRFFKSIQKYIIEKEPLLPTATIQNEITNPAHIYVNTNKKFVKIVNMDHVSAFTKVDVEIGAKEIPIGASYKEQVLKVLKK